MAANKSASRLPIAVLAGVFLLSLLVLGAYSFLPMGGCIGVVEISGALTTEDVPPSLFTDSVKGSETISGELREAGERQDVKAVLLVIDSPGGSVVASQEIYDAIRAMNKTSVSFIREMAASGGYYAAAATDYIVANPDALTGSIGARATVADYSGLMAKLGVNSTTFMTGSLKDMGSSSRPMGAEEREVWQSIVEESFASFRSAVEKRRAGRLDPAGFAQALDARVMTGRQAKRIGLIDELGSKQSAIDAAARMAGMEGEPRICKISSSGGRATIFGSLSAQALQIMLRSAGAPHISYQ